MGNGSVRRGASLGAGTYVSQGVRISAPDIRIGAGGFLAPGVEIQADRVVIGDRCHVAEGVSLRAERIEIGENCILFPGVRIQTLGEFRMGPYGKISRGATIKGGSVRIGSEFWMNAGAEIGGGGWRSRTGCFEAGDRCHVGRLTHINVTEPVVFGDDTAVGMHCILATHAHWQPATQGYPRLRGAIRLGSDVAIYSGVIISPGVTVGHGAVIAAGAVVQTDVPDLSLAAGVPARIVREHFPRGGGAPVALALLCEYMETRFPGVSYHSKAGRFIAQPATGAQCILYDDDESAMDHESRPGSLIVVTLNRAVADAAQSGAETVFNLGDRELTGRSTELSESLRQFFFSAGLRFKYRGYQRGPLDYAQLIESGIE